MNFVELSEMAEKSWPPTQIVLSTVCSRLGSPRQIANKLMLGEYGRQRVRNWLKGIDTIPFSCWLVLLGLDCEN